MSMPARHCSWMSRFITSGVEQAAATWSSTTVFGGLCGLGAASRAISANVVGCDHVEIAPDAVTGGATVMDWAWSAPGFCCSQAWPTCR